MNNKQTYTHTHTHTLSLSLSLSQSLFRMLTQFVERNNGHKLTAEQLLKLNDDANRGDLRSIMKVYDDLIQQPIKVRR